MLPGLIYNACRFELASILMLENVNKHQHFEACLRFLATPANKFDCVKLTKRYPHSQDDGSIPNG